MAWSYPTENDILKKTNDYSSLVSGFAKQPALAATVESTPESVKIEDPGYEVVWKPLPGSQTLALTSPAHHTLYTGARGPGKTACQLMRFRMRVGIGYGAYWRGIIFDREFKNLGDLVAQSNRFFPKFEDGAVWHNSATEYKWIWPTGEQLMFRHVKVQDDYNNFHGWEIPFIGWNELTKQPTSELYDKFMSINRSSFSPEEHTPKVKKGNTFYYDTPDGKPLPPIPLEVFSTTNPSGVGHGWVKERFIEPAKYGEIVKQDISYFDPMIGQERKVERTQVAIFGSFYENPYLDDIYKAGLIQACETEPHLHEAWINGSWDITAGGALDDLWKASIHVVDPFPIPIEWLVDRSFDWGSSHPFATVWWAEANGEEIDLPSGNKWCPVRGSLFAIAEDYGVVKKRDGKPDYSRNEGMKLSANDIADRIIAIEKELKERKSIFRDVIGGPADNQIRDVRESDVETIESKMKKKGIRWTKSDKSPGSRRNGLQLMRDRLQAATTGEKPAIYFFRNCVACIRLLPPLPRDETNIDDVDTNSIDHLWDAVRYRVLKGSNRIASKVNAGFGYSHG